MSTMTVSPNGRVRKSLANEIDRLNQILDGLADGLNEAVATAVQNAVAVAVQQAIQGALKEVLTSPAVIETLREKIVPPAPNPVAVPVQPKTQAVKNTCRHLLGWIGSKLKAVVSAGKNCFQAAVNVRKALLGKVGQVVEAGRQRVVRAVELVPVFVMLALRLARKYQMPLLVAIVIGVCIGVMAFLAGRMMAAIGSGIGAFVTTIVVQAGLWFRRMLCLGSRTEPDMQAGSVS